MVKKATQEDFEELSDSVFALDENMTQSFKNVETDMRSVNERIDKMGVKFNDLKNQLAAAQSSADRATNALEKIKELVDDRVTGNDLAELEAEIKKLTKEVFEDRKDEDTSIFTHSQYLRWYVSGGTIKPTQTPTLNGKVDAIIEHLKLDVEVQPEEVKEAKAVAKKKPAPKKRGRR